MTTPPNPNFAHDIYIAKNDDYLIFKLMSEDRLYIMGVCDRSQTFNFTSFQCDDCPVGLHSFGVQA